jgi:DNA-binding transcriptional ArsR family regulator
MLSYLRNYYIMILSNNPETETEKTDIFELHANFCRCLSNPIRLIILEVLAKGEKSVGEMAEASGVTLANISQHLTVLRSHNIVKRRKAGQTVYYSIVDTRLIDACNLIRSVLLDGMKRQGLIASGINMPDL